LQSSNEELETTNEELQSTNEELQTAYTELKITYEGKEDKAKKLQEISHALKNEQQSMLKQQRLTDTLIESVPVGIIMLDEGGRLSIMNQNAKSILALDSHEITQASMHENAQKIIEQNLPFEIVKKTYEPIYRVGHTIEKNGNEAIYITVNGMPLFDHKGAFVGAVFSIIDNLSVESMNSSSKITSMQELDHKEQFGVVELGLLDVLSTIQSYLGDLSLFTQTLSQIKADSSMQNELQEKINSKINNITTIIESNLNYYKEISFLEKTPFIVLLKRYIKILNQISTGRNIACQDMLHNEILLECNPRKTSLFFIQLFSKLYSTLFDESRSENIVLEISYEENSLIILLKGLQISDNFVKNLSKSPVLGQKHGINGLKDVCIKDTYGKSICI
jgi:PAS domain-containing protein